MPRENLHFNAYYQMWVDRMANGHNSQSQAMHYGYNPDLSRTLSADEAKDATNRLIVQQMNLSKDEKVILGDLGCGVGGTALYITDTFANSHVIGVNIHIPQLKLLRDFPNFSDDRISTVNADFMKLPFQTNSLDGAYAIESSCYANDKPSFYKEAIRTIRPGRKLVIFDAFYKRKPKNHNEKVLLSDSLTGWMVPNWHPRPEEGLFGDYTFTDISKNVMPDVERSYQVACENITKVTDTLMIGHFKTIIAAYKCLKLGLVQYGLLVVTKSEKF